MGGERMMDYLQGFGVGFLFGCFVAIVDEMNWLKKQIKKRENDSSFSL